MKLLFLENRFDLWCAGFVCSHTKGHIIYCITGDTLVRALTILQSIYVNVFCVLTWCLMYSITLLFRQLSRHGKALWRDIDDLFCSEHWGMWLVFWGVPWSNVQLTMQDACVTSSWNWSLLWSWGVTLFTFLFPNLFWQLQQNSSGVGIRLTCSITTQFTWTPHLWIDLVGRFKYILRLEFRIRRIFS